MCQYDSRCPVGTHRPGTVCPYAKTSGGGWRAPRRSSSPIPTGLPRPTTTSARYTNPASRPRLSGGRYTRTAVGDGLSLADLLALAILARSWEKFHAATGMWGVAIVAVLVVLPFAVAVWLSRHCTAWNGTVEGRCGKVRPQPFRRCEVPTHRRPAQLVTAHEVGACVALVSGVLGVWALFAL